MGKAAHKLQTEAVERNLGETTGNNLMLAKNRR